MRDIHFAFIEDDAQLTRWQASVQKTSDALAAGQQRTADLLEFWRKADELYTTK